jgi:hypothetical protein
MGFFRSAGRAYGKVNSAVIKATSPRKWRKSVDNYQQGHHDFSKSANVANLRVSRGKESYDLLIDNDEIHVAYQDKQGKTQWRKAADVGDFTAIDPGKPPSPQGLNRHWANTYKTSGGTYKGFDAKVKYLQDYGYQVAALDKRPYKAWRSGDKKTAESYVQQVESGQRLQGTPEFFGDYIDPKQAHSTADQQYRRRFFQDVSGQSWQQQKGRVWTGSAWRRPPNPPPPPTSGPPPVRPTPKGPSAGPSASTGPTAGKQSRINFGGSPPQNPNPGKGWRFSQNQAVVPPHSAVKPPKTASTDLGEGFSLVPRKNAGGQDATVHFADDRVMVRMKDSQGRESWVYRSAHGTSGKEKGRWYPVGGQAKFKYGDKWIIKGDPANDPYYGRPELGKLYEHANKVLPKTDAELDDFINRYTGSDKGYGLHQDSNYQTIPVEFNDLDVFQDKDKALGNVLNSWKEGYLNKVWGKRETPQIKQLEAPAQASKSREWRYVQEKQAIPPQPVRYSEQKAENKPAGQIEDDRAGVERRKIESQLSDKIIAEFGRGKSGVLAEDHIVKTAQNAELPNFDDLDFVPDDMPAHKVEQIKKQVALSKFGSKSTVIAASGDSPPKDTDDMTRYTRKKTRGAEGNEGDDRIMGAAALADHFLEMAASEADPKTKKALMANATRLTSLAQSLHKQNTLKAEGNATEAEKLARDFYEQSDPQGILDTSKNKPFLGSMPTGVTPDAIEGWNKQSGQHAKNLKDVKGFREFNVPVPWENQGTIRPGQTVNEHLGQVPKAEKRRFAEQEADKWAAKADTNPEAIQKLNALFTGKPLEEINQAPAVDKNIQQYANSIANLFGDFRSRNESLHLLRSGIEPAKQGELNQYETTDSKGQPVTRLESGSPYTERTAETRLFNAENYIYDSGQQTKDEWIKQLIENAPPELLQIDPKLSRSQKRAAINAIAEKTVADVFAKHQQNYANPEAENLGIENIFSFDMSKKFGRELLIDKGDENLNLTSDINSIAATANAIDPATGQPYGYMNALRDFVKNQQASQSIGAKYNQFDQAKVQNQAGFAGALLEQDPDNPVYQNMASNSYNQLARQGNELPTSVVPWAKSVEMTPDQALEAANLAQIEAARQAALPSPEEPYVPPPESGPVPISNRLSRRNKQQNTPVSPTPEQIQEQVLENATPTETPFSLKEPERPGIGAGRTTSSMFDQDTALDQAARAGRYNPLEGQTSVFDQPAQAQPETVKEISIPLYNPGSSGLKNAPKGGVLEYLSKNKIKAPSMLRDKGGEYDGAEILPQSLLAKIYEKNQSASAPDQVVMSLIDQGILPEGSGVNDMWEAARREHQEIPQLMEKNAQVDRFSKQVLNTKTTKGKTEVNLEHLMPGETIELGGKGHEEEFTFKGVLAPGMEDDLDLPRSVINELINEGKEGYVLEDGAKYGVQVIPADQNILKANARDDQEHFVSTSKEVGDEVLYKGEIHVVQVHDYDNGQVFLQPKKRGKKAWVVAPTRGLSRDEKNQLRDEQRREARLLAEKYHNPDVPF